MLVRKENVKKVQTTIEKELGLIDKQYLKGKDTWGLIRENTRISIAVKNNNIPIVRLFLDKGVDYHEANIHFDNDTPSAVAYKLGHLEIESMILELLQANKIKLAKVHF